MKKGLYANINARRKAGKSRPKSKSTISKKALEDIEKLKDANREMKYTNGNGSYSQ